MPNFILIGMLALIKFKSKTQCIVWAEARGDNSEIATPSRQCTDFLPSKNVLEFIRINQLTKINNLRNDTVPKEYAVIRG